MVRMSVVCVKQFGFKKVEYTNEYLRKGYQAQKSIILYYVIFIDRSGDFILNWQSRSMSPNNTSVERSC